MKAKIVKFDNKNVAIGLDWDLIEDESTQKALKKARLENPEIKMGIVLESEGTIVRGFVKGSDIKSGTASAIAWLAEVNKKINLEKRVNGDPDSNWFVIEAMGFQEELGEEGFWFGAVKESLPLPGTDNVLSWDTLSKVLHGFLEPNPKAFEIYTKDNKVNEVFGNIANIVPKGWGELVEGTKPKKKIQTFGSLPVIPIAIVATFVFVGFGYYAYTIYAQNKAQTLAQLALSEQNLQQAQKQAKIMAEYRKQVIEIVKKDVIKGTKELNNALNRGNPYNTIMAWAGIINKISVENIGWKMTKINCDVANQRPECIVSLDRGKFGINRTLAEKIANIQFNGDKSFYIVGAQQIGLSSSNSTQLIGARDFSIGPLSDFELLSLGGINHSISASAELTNTLTLPPPPTPAKQQKNGVNKAPAPEVVKPIDMGVATGQLNLSGNQLWELSSIGASLNYPGFDVTSLNVIPNVSGKIEWSLTLQYFIKTKPYPFVYPIQSANYQGGYVNPETGDLIDQKTLLKTNQKQYDVNGINGSTVVAFKQVPKEQKPQNTTRNTVEIPTTPPH